MVIKDRNGRQLVQDTPFTLLALTRHDIEPHEEHWFARCRADYLRSFPLMLLELVRLSMLLSLVGPTSSLTYSACAVIGWLMICATQATVRNKEKLPGFDEKRALYYRAVTIRTRTVWWSVMLMWGMLIAPQASVYGLVALGCVMMVIDGISVLAMPHQALIASLSGGVSLAIGVAVREPLAEAAPIAVAVLILAAFLHWSIYNLYYMFATRRIRTRRLSQSNETVQMLLNQYDDDGSDWLYEIDADGKIHNPSARFAKACGMHVDRLEGHRFADLLGDGEGCHSLLTKLEESKPFRNNIVAIQVSGEERWWSISGRAIEVASGKAAGWRGFIADVTDAKRAEAKVAFMAHYDLLTQLPNRTLFNATLSRTLARIDKDEILGLLYIDLDHFKVINDNYGHATGDRVLAQVAGRLEATLRPRDMVARLGGDEFVILLSELDSVESGMQAADRVLAQLNLPIEVEGQLMPVGASIGMAFAPHDASDGEDLLRAADLAMYDAKARGRRGVSVFDAEMHEEMKDRRQLEVDLRGAIVRKELALHYQPLVDLRTGITCGYEALLRWDHPTRGMVSPVDFIPIAEETGIIVEIGEWVLRSALAEAAGWPDNLTVAVNLSPAQMTNTSIVAIVVSALASSGVAAKRLELEITENLLIQESGEVLAILHSLRALGVRIALDDFGTGYSSLNYLRSFPFDKIKIDRCFVNEISEREDCQAIVRSVIALANDLNMTTTAEGVEVIEQLEKLKLDGCDQVQGFYFSKAIPAADLHYGVTKPALADGGQEAPLPQAPQVEPTLLAPRALPAAEPSADFASPALPLRKAG